MKEMRVEERDGRGVQKEMRGLEDGVREVGKASNSRRMY